MTTQVIPGKLHKRASYKPKFGSVALSWLMVYFMAQFFGHYSGMHHFGYFGYFILIYAAAITLRWIFTPKYYTKFMPDPTVKKEPKPTEAAEPVKIKIEVPNPKPAEENAVPMFCPNCGMKHAEDDQFCTSCGNSLQF